LLTFLSRKVEPGKTLAVVPEGAMIKRAGTTGEPQSLPQPDAPEIASLGEAHVLQQLSEDSS